MTILPVRKQITTTVPYATLAALQVLTVGISWLFLQYKSGVTEGNPLVEAAIETFGLHLGLALRLAFGVGLVYLLWVYQTGYKFILVVYAFVAINSTSDLIIWIF